MKKPKIAAEYEDHNNFILTQRAIEDGTINVPMAKKRVKIPIFKGLSPVINKYNVLKPEPDTNREVREFELEEIIVIYRYKEI